MRRRTDISRFRGMHSGQLNAMGLLLSSGTISSSTGSPGDAATRTRRQETASTHDPHQTMPSSTRTSIDSPGLITSVGYILIAGRSAAAQPAIQNARLEAPRIVVSSRTGEFKADRPPRTREIEWEGKCAISTGRCTVLRKGPTRPGRPLRESHMSETDTRTFATGPPASALTTRPPNSTVTIVFGSDDGGAAERGPVTLSAVASNAGDDARTNRDEAKMSQHIPAPVLSVCRRWRASHGHQLLPLLAATRRREK